MAKTSWPTCLRAKVPKAKGGGGGFRIKMAALIKTLARKQIRRGEKLINARNIGFQKHTLRLWHGPDYRAHRIHTPQAYWLRQCLICFPQPTHSTLQFTGEGIREKEREWLWYDCENCDESISFRSKATVHRTENESWVNMAVQIERVEIMRKNERGKSTSIKEKWWKRAREETIFCISTRWAAAWFFRASVSSLRAC